MRPQHLLLILVMLSNILTAMDKQVQNDTIMIDLIKSKIDAGSFENDQAQAFDLIKRCLPSSHGPLCKYAQEKGCSNFIAALFTYYKTIPCVSVYIDTLLKTQQVTFDVYTTFVLLTTIAHHVNISEVCACIQLLHNAHISLDCSDEYETSVLMKYVQWGYYALAKSLIDHGCNANYKNMLNGRTALHFARASNIIELLITTGADANATDYERNTPLHQLSSKYYTPPAPIESLVRLGARMNAQNYYGNTPLHEAMKKKNESAILTLLQLGADPFIKNLNGESAIPIKLCKAYTRTIHLPIVKIHNERKNTDEQ